MRGCDDDDDDDAKVMNCDNDDDEKVRESESVDGHVREISSSLLLL